MQDVLAVRSEDGREARFASGTQTRTEREIWAWEGRDPDLTTPLQKVHLNTRNRRRKVKEERALVRTRNEKDKRRAKLEAKLAKERGDVSVDGRVRLGSRGKRRAGSKGKVEGGHGSTVPKGAAPEPVELSA